MTNRNFVKIDTSKNQFCIEMVDVKIFVVSVVAVLSILLQPGIRAQSTISSYSSEDDSCPQLKEEWEFVEEYKRLRIVLESEQQRVKTLESITSAQSEENRLLKLELENERRRRKSQELLSGNALYTLSLLLGE